jgi:hypothetical protein
VEANPEEFGVSGVRGILVRWRVLGRFENVVLFKS